MRTSERSWGQDFGRLLIASACSTGLATLLLGLASLGILRGNNLDLIAADPAFAGICATLPAFMLPFLLLKTSRADNGYRTTGLVPLMLVGVVLAAVIQVLVMMLWSFLLSKNTAPGTNAAMLGTNLPSLLIVFAFVVMASAWICATVLVLMSSPWWVAVIVVVPFLGEVFLFGFLGIRALESPPTLLSLLLYGLAGVVGLGVLALVCALRLGVRRQGALSAARPASRTSGRTDP